MLNRANSCPALCMQNRFKVLDKYLVQSPCSRAVVLMWEQAAVYPSKCSLTVERGSTCNHAGATTTLVPHSVTMSLLALEHGTSVWRRVYAFYAWLLSIRNVSKAVSLITRWKHMRVRFLHTVLRSWPSCCGGWSGQNVCTCSTSTHVD